MDWGGVSSVGVGRLKIVDGMMNSAKYFDTLESKMLPSENEMFPEKDFAFEDDKAPCHRAKVVKQWFAPRHIKIGQSPDLNPNENLSHKFGYEISKMKPSTKLELIEAVIAAWSRLISPDLLETLVSSMPKRFMAVIKSNGWQTKY